MAEDDLFTPEGRSLAMMIRLSPSEVEVLDQKRGAETRSAAARLAVLRWLWLAVLAFAVAAFTSACAPAGSFERKNFQDEAERIVWRELYGMHCDPPPTEWIHVHHWGDWQVGFTYAGWKIQVADGEGSPHQQIHDTVWTHELMHYKMALETGDVDAAHRRGDWELADEEAPVKLAAEWWYARLRAEGY